MMKLPVVCAALPIGTRLRPPAAIESRELGRKESR